MQTFQFITWEHRNFDRREPLLNVADCTPPTLHELAIPLSLVFYFSWLPDVFAVSSLSKAIKYILFSWSRRISSNIHWCSNLKSSNFLFDVSSSFLAAFLYQKLSLFVYFKNVEISPKKIEKRKNFSRNNYHFSGRTFTQKRKP